MKKTQKSYYEKELAKAVHAHNEKIRYHEAKGASHLPERQSLSALKNMLTTKKDFEKTIRELRTFGQKGMEQAVRVSEKLIVSKWEKQVVEKQVETINRSRRAKRAVYDSLDVTNRGEKVGYKRGELPSTRTAELKPKKLNWENIRSKSELAAYKKTLKFQTTEKYWKQKAEQLRFNYIQGLFNTYGNRATGIISKIGKMPVKDFMKKFYAEQNATVNFIYEPLSEDTKLDALEMIWLEDEAGDLDLDEYFEI